MNIDERIKSHLEASTSHVQATSRLESIMAEGRNRRVRARMAGVLGAAAAVAAIVAVTAVILPGDGRITDPTTSGVVDTGPVTTAPPTVAPDTSAPSEPAGEARGVIIADSSGVRTVTANGETELELTSEQLGGEIGLAFPDTRGGLVFQHTDTPDPWPQGSILHLAAGSQEPEVLAAPAEDERPPVPVGLARAADGSPAFVYLIEDVDVADESLTVMRTSLESGASEPVLEMAGAQDIGVGGNILSSMNRVDRGCAVLTMVDMNTGEEIPAPVDDCLPIDTGVAVGHDGEALAVLSGDQLEIYDLGSGASTISRSIPAAYMVTSGPGGWVVRTPDESVLITTSGITSLPPVDTGWVIPAVEALDLSPESPTTQGSKGACAAAEAPLEDQDLPPEVAETRAQIFQLAAACDYDRLADLALESSTHLTFGDGGEDPASMWLDEGEGSIEPLGALVTLLNTSPAFDDEAGIWAWPAVQVEPDDEDAWAELEAELGREVVETLRPGGNGYYGHRVGITTDGQWQYFVAGD